MRFDKTTSGRELKLYADSISARSISTAHPSTLGFVQLGESPRGCKCSYYFLSYLVILRHRQIKLAGLGFACPGNFPE